MPIWMYPSGADAGSEASVNQEPHQPSRPGPSAPIQNRSASTSSVEQPAKPYTALLQLEGERKRLIDEIIYFVENQLEDPGLPRGKMYEQALRLLWNELDIDESTSLDELQYRRDSQRENPQQYKSIFGFYNISPGGYFLKGILLQVIERTRTTKVDYKVFHGPALGLIGALIPDFFVPPRRAREKSGSNTK